MELSIQMISTWNSELRGIKMIPRYPCPTSHGYPTSGMSGCRYDGDFVIVSVA